MRGFGEDAPGWDGCDSAHWYPRNSVPPTPSRTVSMSGGIGVPLVPLHQHPAVLLRCAHSHAAASPGDALSHVPQSSPFTGYPAHAYDRRDAFPRSHGRNASGCKPLCPKFPDLLGDLSPEQYSFHDASRCRYFALSAADWCPKGMAVQLRRPATLLLRGRVAVIVCLP